MSATAKAVLVAGRLFRNLILVLTGGGLYDIALFDDLICLVPSRYDYWLSTTISQSIAFTKLRRSQVKPCID